MENRVTSSVEQDQWAQQYQLALRRYLSPDSGARLATAARLGRRAIELQLDTLDVARIHTQALPDAAKGAPALPPGDLAKRSNRFFAETLSPIEHTHRAARDADAQVRQTKKKVLRRRREAEDATQQLDRSISQRRTAAAALKDSDRRQSVLVKESHKLKQQLQDQLHRMLHVQEGEKKKISEQLHEEVAQTLVALQLRLRIMDAVAEDNTEILKKEVAATRKLVRESTRTIGRLKDECGTPKTK